MMQRILLVCFLASFTVLTVALENRNDFVVIAQSKPSLPKSHRHIGVRRADVGETIADFTMTETSLATTDKKENIVKSRDQNYEAFTLAGTRLLIANGKTGKIFEIRGLPLEWRPFSTLTWADNRTLMFDRWSQPHYGVHYAVDVKDKRLIAAVPFPDKFFVDQQRPKKPSLD